MENHQDGDGVVVPEVLREWGAPERLG
jgi:seryl-tRNA synthetase